MVKASTCLTFMGIVLGMIILAFYVAFAKPNPLNTTVSDNIQSETEEYEDEEIRTAVYDEYGQFVGYEEDKQDNNQYQWE